MTARLGGEGNLLAEQANLADAALEIAFRQFGQGRPSEAGFEINLGERENLVGNWVPARTEVFGVPQRGDEWRARYPLHLERGLARRRQRLCIARSRPRSK